MGRDLRCHGPRPSFNILPQRAPGATSQGPRQFSVFGENSPNICPRLFDPFTQLNATLSFFFFFQKKPLHSASCVRNSVYLLTQQKRQSLPALAPHCSLAERRPLASPHGSSASLGSHHHICLASQEHHEPKARPRRLSEGKRSSFRKVCIPNRTDRTRDVRGS